MRIERFGFRLDDREQAEAKSEFARRQCVKLPHFLAQDLTRNLMTRLENEPWTPVSHFLSGNDKEEFGQELSAYGMVRQALVLMLNNTQLFSAIHEITGCGEIGCFKGRLYRTLPNAEHRLDWHDDMSADPRLIGLSINLTSGSLEGGEFRIRKKSSHELLAEITHAEPGGAHIFRIDRSLEHSVAPCRGQVPRTAFAGWFQTAPDYDTVVRELLN